ncbi:MAG: SURF1-like protein [Litorilinea sp.]|uniref:SURF1-like protein n=1 Tax=Litorilinea aerophila TaxID=1204385 RepID=A0A540VK55_9CHLR|nr:MAG: SURF1-like protein [Litorilinea sp.]
MVVLKLFNRRWWWTTLLVIAGVAVLIRLGFWQLDRLEQRRAFNAMVAERWKQEPYDLAHNPLPADLQELEYRRVEVEGEFDYERQLVLVSQTRSDGAPGVILVTPLVFEDGRAVLVARGWIPSDLAAPENWPQFQEPPGQPVIGLIQESQMLPNGEAPPIPDSPQTEWFRINIDAIQPQMPYQLLPVFILQLPEEGRPYDALPYREEPLRLDEGSHLSYAIQWFTFAAILAFGYLQFIQHQERREQMLQAQAVAAEEATAVEGEAPSGTLPSGVDTQAGGLPRREGHA